MTNDSNSIAVSPGLRAALGYYRLVAEIGRGGMASVFLSLFPNGDGTSRKVVLKQLHPELALDEDFRLMFENEARLSTRLHHDNVVETYDIYSDDELCVLVMEFLDGQTFSRVRTRARKLSNVPLSIQLRILAEVLAGLHYVHELTDERGAPLGIVHRDVTPSNVFVTYDGRVKVVDFGIAKATTRIAETRMGVLKGKLAYMSPEAVRGEPVDRRSDIFSVGVMLWEAATGLSLWRDHDEVAVYRRLATGDLPIHPTGAPPVNPHIMRIAQRALAVDPFQRYQTADEMQFEIEDLLAQLGRLTRAPALSAYMESFFAVEREKFEAVVDRALRRFPTRPISQRRLIANELSDSYPSLDPYPALDPSDPPTTVSTPNGGTFRSAAYDVPLESQDIPDFRPPRRWVAFAAIAAAFAVGVAGIAHAPANFQTSWLGSMLRATAAGGETASSVAVAAGPGVAAPSPAAAAANATTAPPGSATAPGAPAPKGMINVVFTARPAAARFYLDGELLEGNPAKLQKPLDDKRHRVRAEAPGYATLWRPVDFDRDLTREFDLVRYVPQAAAPRAAAPAAEPREDAPKPRRGKRPLDRDDPWAP